MQAAQSEQNKTQIAKTQKLKMNEKLTFGLGDFGANYSWTFIASFLTIYMTDTVGISAGIIGTIILISRVTDGFTDLFMGTLIDNTNTKMGKAKPWVFWTAPILGLLTFLLFNVPGALGQTGKIIYIFLIYLLISAVFYTANNVAYSSLTSLMTNDKNDRVSLGSIRFIFSQLAVLSITTFTTFLVSGFGGGQQGWTITTIIYALLCAVPLMITGWFVKERNIAKRKTEENTTQRVPFFLIMKVLLTNKYFIITIILYLLWYLRQTDNGIRVYYATYVFNNADVMAILSLATTVPTIIGLMYAPKFVKMFGIRKSITIGLIISIISYLIMTVFSENLTLLTVGLIVNAIGVVPFTGALSAIVADVGDLIYWKSGVPVQGSVFSLTSAGMKIGSGLQGAIVGWALTVGGYIAGSSIQPDSSILAMKSMQIYFPFACIIIIMLVTFTLNYEKFLPSVKREIEEGKVGENRTKDLAKI
ncbi:MFS transporter [Oceanobacillus locisalsi]|uniref:MFS transporter n=1 Tax=Oceanobacillus locisalsi TaxID=546107 RepID=A0ABW3NFY7_9BACI